MEHHLYSLKACPIVVRVNQGRREILAFQHPEAGKQVVKGTIDPDEDPAKAALRELAEESGITHAEIDRFLRQVHFETEGQTWHIYLCKVTEHREQWTHVALEGDGRMYNFRFFWQDLDGDLDEEWEDVFRQVISLVRQDLPTC